MKTKMKMLKKRLYKLDDGFSFAETNQYTIDTILKEISVVKKPYISNGYIVFTAEDKARHVGIAFDFDNYKTIHSFQRLTSYTIDNEERSSVLFYLLKLPEDSSKVPAWLHRRWKVRHLSEMKNEVPMRRPPRFCRSVMAKSA